MLFLLYNYYWFLKEGVMSDNKNKSCSHRDAEFYNIWRRIFNFIVTHIFYKLIFKIIYRVEVYGRENIPKTNDYIIASNHLSTLDPPLVCSVIDKGVAYMAKKELFENVFMRWWLNWLGAFAVDRERLHVSTIKTAKTIKETGWVLGIFPQGTRQEAGKFNNVAKGFVALAKSTKCGILPIGIDGTQNKTRIPFKGKVVIKIGKLIPYSENLDEMFEKWITSIQDLTGYKYEKEVV